MLYWAYSNIFRFTFVIIEWLRWYLYTKKYPKHGGKSDKLLKYLHEVISLMFVINQALFCCKFFLCHILKLDLCDGVIIEIKLQTALFVKSDDKTRFKIDSFYAQQCYDVQNLIKNCFCLSILLWLLFFSLPITLLDEPSFSSIIARDINGIILVVDNLRTGFLTM